MAERTNMSDVMDEGDMAEEQERKDRDRCVEQARKRAKEIPVGYAGDCAFCGEWSGRLVEDVCAPCRDKYHLK